MTDDHGTMAKSPLFRASAADDNDDSALLRQMLASMNRPQSLGHNARALRSLGGVGELVRSLASDADRGMHTAAVASRRARLGSNALPSSPRASFWSLFVDTFDDGTLQILIAAALVSLSVGLYEGGGGGCVEGVAILAAVLLVSLVTAVNDDQKERQFRALSRTDEAGDASVVLRDGRAHELPSSELVVGDVVCVEAGDRVPCDGVLLQGTDCSVDESALTGEPTDVAKNATEDPFLLSGCTLSTGDATLLAIAVGKESQWGVIKAHLDTEQEQTPLQEKLDVMSQRIGYVGMACAVATFIAMTCIKVFVDPPYLHDADLFSHCLHAFIIGVTIVVVAVPEGLPLAVTIALAFSTQKMLQDNNLVRHLAACETMGSATNICSDKTGTLTKNEMTVVRGVLAGERLEGSTGRSNFHVGDKALHTILQCIACCSTARVVVRPGNERPRIVGNKTEAALLLLVRDTFGFDDAERRRARAGFGQEGGSRLFPFSSARKRMSAVVREDDSSTLYHKGAAETVLADCTTYLRKDGSRRPLTDRVRRRYADLISDYAHDALRCVALAHRDDVIVPTDNNNITDLETDLCFDGMVGIADPLREDAAEAVRTCQRAGIVVRMVTGDNIDTANAIAREAGILREDSISMIGEDFRVLTPAQLDKVLPRLHVLARSSPEDKHILVQRLNGGLLPRTEQQWREAHPGKDFHTMKDRLLPGYYDEWAVSRGGVGEVVGVTGDGTNDGPALKAADVGLSMGVSGTDVAKNASDIVILDDNFSSIVRAVLWGRSVYDNIRKFLQFQLTVNVVALTVTFLSAVAGYEPPLNAVMMLWVNLIMDTMGALALGTEPPVEGLLERRPYKRDASLVSAPMWRNVLVQAAYQLGLLLFLLREGPDVFGCEDGSRRHFTILFNAFVFCQIFNEFNAREIGDDFQPLAKLGSSPMFVGVILFTVLSQWFIVSYGGDFTKTQPLTLGEWTVTGLFGALSIPVGWLMRRIPVSEDPRSFSGKVVLSRDVDVDDETGSATTKSLTTFQILQLSVPMVGAVFYQLYVQEVLS